MITDCPIHWNSTYYNCWSRRLPLLLRLVHQEVHEQASQSVIQKLKPLEEVTRELSVEQISSSNVIPLLMVFCMNLKKNIVDNEETKDPRTAVLLYLKTANKWCQD